VTGGHRLPLPPVNHTAPVPGRIRAVLDGRVVADTTPALNVWEWSPRAPLPPVTSLGRTPRRQTEQEPGAAARSLAAVPER
jgi:hypothetical protein